MSTNGVKCETWAADAFGAILRPIYVEEIRRGHDGDFFATIRIAFVAILPDGRRLEYSTRRKVRGKCVNARRGRPRKVQS